MKEWGLSERTGLNDHKHRDHALPVHFHGADGGEVTLVNDLVTRFQFPNSLPSPVTGPEIARGVVVDDDETPVVKANDHRINDSSVVDSSTRCGEVGNLRHDFDDPQLL